MSRRIALLGSTGSIGRQSLEVIAACGMTVAALTANRDVERLEAQCRAFAPELAVLMDETAAADLRVRLADTQVRVASGMEGLLEAASLEGADTVLTAVVGMVGLRPTLAAVRAGKRVALANKETLVCAGELVLDEAQRCGARLVPVDSEHSAIFQCLQGCRDRGEVKRLILTASGGPFFGWDRTRVSRATREQALKHPNWSMGAKITIDSATLMNKGLELIEAVWLFGLPPEKIQIVVQRQSIVHSAVQFSDHSVIAQLGVPDMRIPIQYALTYPARVPGVVPELDFTTLKLLTFDVADEETFRCLAACKKAIRKGGLGPCAANGANEEAVRLFLEDKIGFLDIGRLVEAVVDSDSFGGSYSLADVYECDRMARAFVRAHL